VYNVDVTVREKYANIVNTTFSFNVEIYNPDKGEEEVVDYNIRILEA